MKIRKKIFDHLRFKQKILDANNCKVLDYKSSIRYFFEFRDRFYEDQSYYLVTIKGNYIRGYRIKYLDENGKGINTFTGLFIPTLISKEAPKKIPTTQKELLLKMPFKDYRQFVGIFKQLTPNLEWHEE
jgi:hypothetical protein